MTFESIEETDVNNRTNKKHARVAQWLEHWSSKPGVDSSILSSGIERLNFFASCVTAAFADISDRLVVLI